MKKNCFLFLVFVSTALFADFKLSNYSGDDVTVIAKMDEQGNMTSQNLKLSDNESKNVRQVGLLRSLQVNSQPAWQLPPMITESSNLEIEIVKNEKGYKININAVEKR